MRARGWLLLAGVGAVILAGFVGLRGLVFVLDGGGGSLTTDTASSVFPSDAAKVAFLRKYLKLPVPVETAEFKVVYHDNGFAPSDWHIVAALKLAPADVPRLTLGMTPSADALPDYSWGKPLTSNHARFRHSSTPKTFLRQGCRVVAFEAEGVVFQKCTTLEAN